MSFPPGLAALLAPFCSPQIGPGPGPFQAVNQKGILAAADHLGIAPAKVMALCLEREIWPLRFARNRGVFTAAEQRQFLESRAAIIGCGGLGGHVATLLARAGVGAFTLCDFDVFDESNLNRQILCNETNLGRNKAVAAREELARIASHADIRTFPVKAELDNLSEILQGADIVMDCLDSLEARRYVSAAADEAKKPFVHGAIAGEEGFVMVALPGKRSMDLLYQGVAPAGEKGAELVLGAPTVTPAAIAALQVRFALMVLAGRELGETQLCHVDLSGPLLEMLIL
jgi:molybdopterin/thiamine biosynthesis adenylyltransferase